MGGRKQNYTFIMHPVRHWYVHVHVHTHTKLTQLRVSLSYPHPHVQLINCWAICERYQHKQGLDLSLLHYTPNTHPPSQRTSCVLGHRRSAASRQKLCLSIHLSISASIPANAPSTTHPARAILWSSGGGRRPATSRDVFVAATSDFIYPPTLGSISK